VKGVKIKRLPLHELPARQRTALLKKALKERYPGVKFAVKTRGNAYARDVTVKWVDGPTEREVEEIGRAFTHPKGGDVGDYFFTSRSWSDETLEKIDKMIQIFFSLPSDKWERNSRIRDLRWQIFTANSFHPDKTPVDIKFKGSTPIIVWKDA